MVRSIMKSWRSKRPAELGLWPIWSIDRVAERRKYLMTRNIFARWVTRSPAPDLVQAVSMGPLLAQACRSYFISYYIYVYLSKCSSPKAFVKLLKMNKTLNQNVPLGSSSFYVDVFILSLNMFMYEIKLFSFNIIELFYNFFISITSVSMNV